MATVASAVKRTRRKEARPGELLAAALTLFVEKGYAATRVEEVAQRAGVSKGTLFLYYPSKQELFKAVVRDSIAGRLDEWSHALDTFEGSSADLLLQGLLSWWDRIGSTSASGIPKLMMSEMGNFPELVAFFEQEVVQPAEALIQRVLQRGVARGEFRPQHPHYGIYSVLAHLLFLSLWKHARGACNDPRHAIDPKAYLTAQVQTLLYGLSIAPAPGAPSPGTPTSSHHGNSP